ncbi:PREDICTED: uncharacterized protein LOC100636149 [Amphimedon queenslandica]|uniref:Uncharacterized protein n=1 Tax=Amphimedon queenslandica TaxID=400682 RepID=A0A1X7VB88_AMPQE|nr:PREDICTED: uncharacterized protein LOC100636149 [Amphimedon queenslandica]|eukprot:XP_003385013.1 PREDICTED: uncharacterized protein LOC100636149 [Amphimedon queenslandica]
MAATLFLLLSVFAGLSLSANNSTEGIYNNGQEMEGTEPAGVFSGLDFASIANKVLIVVIVIIGIVAAILAYKYYRTQQRRAKLSRYRRLEKTEQSLKQEDGDDDEIVVYEKD